MKSSDDIFHLIKSLDRSEKRYFKLFSTFHGGNKKYMIVFNAIDKQKTYNEKMLIESFKEEKFINRFPVIKQYLYELILNSLEAYHTSIDSVLAGYLHRIDILFKKSLHVQCEKIIVKAKRLAIKHEKKLSLITLIRWEIVLIRVRSYKGITKERVMQIYNEIINTIEDYKTFTNLDCILSSLYLYTSEQGRSHSEKDKKVLSQIINNPLLSAKKDNLSFASLNSVYELYGIYFLIQSEYEKAYPYIQKQVNLIETQPHQIENASSLYIFPLQHLIICQISLKEFDKALNNINKLKSFKIKAKNMIQYVDFQSDHLELSLYIEMGAFNRGSQLIKPIEKKIETYRNRPIIIPHVYLLTFYYNASYIFFATKNYIEAKRYLNYIINESIDIKVEVQSFARILDLIICFETGDYELLEYRVKSVHRFLYKRNLLNKLETIILDFIRKEIPEIHSDKELLKSFEVLLMKMKAIASDPFEERTFAYFDFISWLESKIENRPFVEIVRGKAGISQ